MKKSNVIYTVIAGNVIINIPIYIYSYYQIFSKNADLNFNTVLLVFCITSLYWSILVPFYKLYSIKKFRNKDEYLLWEKWSIYTLVIWPEHYNLNKFEFWGKDRLNLYKKLKGEVLASSYHNSTHLKNENI